MKLLATIALTMLVLCSSALGLTESKDDDVYSYACSRKKDLQLSVYATAHLIKESFTTDAGRREVLAQLKANGITKVYLEVYRSGLVIPPDLLSSSIQLLKRNGFEVVGGIATVPGEGFAKMQDGPLTWCNWQNPKTQADFKQVMQQSAPLFDTFVIDDFLCTADTSMESKNAKGAQSWSNYRRGLLTHLADEILIKPAKAANPKLKIILKYPQWYDRFHLFGYDVESGPRLFDQIWVGTETRGQYTQRFGFVQPYEGFINYRWIASLAGRKIGGAWFDYGDCGAEDFVEQAYQSVLAGARELVLFSMYELLQGHPGHHLLRQKFAEVADLAKTVAQHPVIGTAAYKPPHSDAGGDLYLMDGIGMFGISLVPVSSFPSEAKVILLPTQAATDKQIGNKIAEAMKRGTRIILTTGFLAHAPDGEKLARLAGIGWPIANQNVVSAEILRNNQKYQLKIPLKLESPLVATEAEVLLEAFHEGGGIPFLLKSKHANLYLLNVHTFSEADFAAVGEVLLSPRQLGLYELPEEWANTLRSTLQINDLPQLNAPARVSMQQLSDGSSFIQNYNQEAVTVTITYRESPKMKELFTNQGLETKDNSLKINMPARSRIWIGKNQ